MPDLIERDNAVQAIEAYLCSRCERNSNEVCHNCPHLDSAEILRSVPTIEAEPVKHDGKWIPCKDAFPASKEPVIFTVDRGHPFVCVGYRINSERNGLKIQRWFDKLSLLNFSDYDVKAWMPMPDAYEQPESEVQDDGK